MPTLRQTVLSLALLTLPVAAVQAQEVGKDVPQSHWAYEAVQDLASKGIIKGFPPSGNFFGGRQVTRYEMATIIQRALAYLEDKLKPMPTPPPPANNPGVTQEQLDEVKRLVSEFKVELTVIGTDLQKVKDQLAELAGKLEGIQKTADQAAADAAEAKKGLEDFRKNFADLQESISTGRGEFELLRTQYNARKLSGYLQARFEAFEPGHGLLFAAGSGGTGQSPSNGGPAVGGPKSGWLIRRARHPDTA